MEKLKFVLFSIISLSLLGLLGYWSVVTLQSGSEYKTSQKVEQLKKENEDLKTEVKNLTDELSVLQSKPVEEPVPSVKKDSAGTASKYQNLIDELQKLKDGNVFLKLKSSGLQVGTVQKFLNIYSNTSNKVDNDYGASTVKAVAAFQKDSGLNADGQAGPSTFSKMINWLEKQT